MLFYIKMIIKYEKIKLYRIICFLFAFIILLAPINILGKSIVEEISDNKNFMLPSNYDLRNVDGENYVSGIREQQGSTCWIFGTMASIESNLLINNNWKNAVEQGEPDLAEYHLDWWNGFNIFNNDDDPESTNGIAVHGGGDFTIAAAYLSRGEGAVRDIDGQSYILPPERKNETYHYYYVRNIEWYGVGRELQNINSIKMAIISYGAVGTIINIDQIFFDEMNFTHYQPPSSNLDSWAHAIAVIGWDDEKKTQAPHPGAWLCKNSWGTDWGMDGYFWVSYYDKFCCQEDKYGTRGSIGLGAVSFKDTEPLKYDKIYYHDYHGIRNSIKWCNSVFNAFKAEANEIIEAVSFYTLNDNVEYTIKIYDNFENNKLKHELINQSGILQQHGFHTIDLSDYVAVEKGNDFYIYLMLSNGGYAIDQTSIFLKPLFGAKAISPFWLIRSDSRRGESFFYLGSHWLDIHFLNPSANFCIKCLCRRI